MDEPSISIIICTWNRCQLLAETLKTLQSQRIPVACKIEVLIIDNNCTDQTAAIVKEFQKNWGLGDLRYFFEPKQGKQFALNHAIVNATGAILAFTDDDVILPNDWIKNILEIFSRQDVELAGGKTLLVWPHNKPPLWFRQSMLSVVAGVDHGDQRLCPPPPDYSPAGTNLVARSWVFQRIGLFSETHYRHEDYELGVRAVRHGIMVEYNPRLIVYARVPENILNKAYFRRWYFNLGITTATSMRDHSPSLFGVPRWIWRQLLVDVLAAGTYWLARSSDKEFEHELLSIKLLGYVSSTWCQKLWPARHPKWVRYWTQKLGAKFV
jgi:glycosyltransferase involved in cell wall biosynthesis